MKDMFVLLRQDESIDWFLLCVKPTLFCIASGPLDLVLESLRKICKNYRVESNLREKMDSMTYGHAVPAAEFVIRKSLYKYCGDKYQHYIEETIEEHYEQVREHKKMKKPVLVKAKKAPVVQEHTIHVETSHKVSMKKLVRKPIKIHIK